MNVNKNFGFVTTCHMKIFLIKLLACKIIKPPLYFFFIFTNCGKEKYWWRFKVKTFTEI